MMRIFLVRHGETEWNKRGIFRGTADVALNEKGKEQAGALGLRFAKLPLRAIYTSKLARASETARAIAKQQPERKVIYADDGFTDIDRGEWEGLTHEQARQRYPELYEKWISSPQEVEFPGGDALREVQGKARAAIDRIQAKTDGDVAVVTHHVVIRGLLCSLLDLDLSHFRKFEVFPASVSQVVLEYGRWVLYRLNDVCHLAEARRSGWQK